MYSMLRPEQQDEELKRQLEEIARQWEQNTGRSISLWYEVDHWEVDHSSCGEIHCWNAPGFVEKRDMVVTHVSNLDGG